MVLLVSILTHCKSKEDLKTGVVTFLKGEVTLTDQGKKSALKFGEEVKSGNLIETGQGGVVIVSFASGESDAEIQSNSKFLIGTYNETQADLSIETGSVWFRVNQKGKKNFSLTNPTAVAGVRGTKFFTFQIDKDTFGTCHCEGKVHYALLNSDQATDNDRDFMIVVRNGKSITIEPSEFKEIHPGNTGLHAHSEIENSNLGKVRSFSPEDRKRLIDRIESKFAKL